MTSRSILPPGWKRPRGYTNGIAARGEFLAVAGQIGWDGSETFVGDGFAEQFHQALANVVDIVKTAGGQAEHLISLTIYVCDKQEYIDQLPSVGASWREIIGKHYPTMALVEVSALLEDRAKVEIQALAVLPVQAPA